MNLAHHRPDESFNVSAEMRRSNRTIVDRDTVLLTAAAQRLGMKLFGVVEVKPGKQSLDRPLLLDLSLCQPRLLGHRCVSDAERHAGGGRGFKRQVKSRDATGVDIDCQ